MTLQQKSKHLAFVGFGEAANAFLDGWASNRPDHVAAFDIKTDSPETREPMRALYAEKGVAGAGSVAEALSAAEVVFSTVTADQALSAATAAARHLKAGALWLDCNSCAPETKKSAAQIIGAQGGRYVDVAVMSPVNPKKHRAPLLVSGPHADAAITVLEALDMCPTRVGDTVGQASSIKMIRSVMIKGLEALTAECFLAARRAGVDDQVIASLEASDPDIAWRRRGAYNLERMMVHGQRRAAEMREVALTVEELGLPNGMSQATVEWQSALSRHSIDPGEDDLASRLDRALSTLSR